MTKRTWWTGLSVGCVVWGLGGMMSSRAIAQGSGATVVSSFEEYDGECEPRCSRGLSFCNKLRMHHIYHQRKCSRPYRQLDYIPAEIAPYIGPGTWHSPGYGLPYGAAPGVSGGYRTGAPPVGYAR
jgi:hypothetical protein